MQEQQLLLRVISASYYVEYRLKLTHAQRYSYQLAARIEFLPSKDLIIDVMLFCNLDTPIHFGWVHTTSRRGNQLRFAHLTSEP